MHCYSHNLQCHKASTCTLPVRYDAKAMAEERELYRTRIHEFVPKTNGVMIVSSARLIIRWDYGEVAQYPLHHIRSVMASSDVRHVYFQKRPGVRITLMNGKALVYETPAAAKLASQIEKAMLPF